MPALDYFSQSYSQARSRFLNACSEVDGGFDATLRSYENSRVSGAQGERLFVDVARLGPAHASRLFVIGSGTHGVEGFCGSGCQLGLLQEKLYKMLPQDTALLLVHAINPHGFSHVRRVDENNVDVNRNFFSPDKPFPLNAGYEALHKLLLPADWNGRARAEADAGIEEFISAHGEAVYQAAVTGGQYSHSDGLFYGGLQPVWSHTNLRTIVAEYMSSAQRVLFIDVHTGVGPYGYGEPILVDTNFSHGTDCAKSWFGDKLTDIRGEGCISAVVEGPISNALRWGLEAEFMILSLEYGTRPVAQAIDALRADNWLYQHPEADAACRAQIKAQIRDAFYVEEDEWSERVWQQFLETFHSGAAGLAGT